MINEQKSCKFFRHASITIEKTNQITHTAYLYSGAYIYDIIADSTKILLILTKKKSYTSAKPYIRHGVIVHMPNSECLVPHISVIHSP